MTNQLYLVTILDSPCASIEWNFINVGSVNVVSVPFVLRYFAFPRFDRWYPIYLVHPRYLKTCLLVPVILQLRDLVTCLRKPYDAISPSGPRVLIRHSNGQIPLWSICILINHLFRIPKVHHYGQYISVRWWDTNQSLLIDDNYVWSLRSNDLVTTL